MAPNPRGSASFPARLLELQLLRYLCVAIAAAAVDFGTLFLLSGIGSLHYAAGATIAFSLGLLVNFTLARRWVFGGTAMHVGGEFAGYAAIGLVGVALTELVLFLGIDVLRLGLAPSKAAALAIVFFWNFLARRSLIYRTASISTAAAGEVSSDG